jgi:hypothetical protein
MATHRSPAAPVALPTPREPGSGFEIAAVLMLTLSAPALSSARTSSTARTPPPTVQRKNTCAATSLIIL